MKNQEDKNELAQELCKSVAEKFRSAALVFDDPGEGITLIASVSLVGVVAVSIFLGPSGNAAPPTKDDILFASLYISSSCSFAGNGTAKVEFDIMNVVKVLDQFHQLTGRSYERRINESLLDRVNEIRNDTTKAYRTQ
jgi:hypothetical protein